MDKNLKNALIIIAVLVGLYYLISPYQNCMRDFKSTSNTNLDKSWHEPKYKIELHLWAQERCGKKGFAW